MNENSENPSWKRYLPTLVAGLIVFVVLAAVLFIIRRPGAPLSPAEQPRTTGVATGLSGDVAAIAEARGLTPDDISAALKTYVPSGQHDEFIMFSSSGHAGQVYVIGVPSMRILRSIAVFTPEPWQGYGYGDQHSMDILREGSVDGTMLTWGDTHHPGLSQTNGEYDGEFLFINDKAHARIAVIDLKDFKTKQIVKNPIAVNDHGGAFVTANTEWVVEGGQYAAPLGWEYAPIEDYEAQYRGMITFWKFDRASGRLLMDESFAIELPPYWQDICAAGSFASEGWVYCNSINTELATGGVEVGNPPFESGVSQNEMDYLHIINLKKAAEVARAGNVTQVNGFNVISLATAAAEGLLYFAPEPKSPHGVDISPNGEFIVVSGKLSPHVTIYSQSKIDAAIAKGTSETDRYGVPILAFDDVVEAQVELGLGPLHTQFDDKGYAYTSLFLDSAIVRWTLGGAYADMTAEPSWSVVSKISVHYNVGHLSVAGGDMAKPYGRYLVAQNKWSVDRFANVGPLLPQNFQLIDISQPGDSMQLLYDMPIGIGEPHYGQMIRTDKLNAWQVYPEVGWNASTHSVDANATLRGQERVVRNGNNVEIWMSVIRSQFNPERVEIKKGDHVVWHLTNQERAVDAIHGFAIPGYNINLSLEPGETITIEFTADKDGIFSFYCTEFCSALHLEMKGYLMIQP
jgi:nitrous-oxide reductase